MLALKKKQAADAAEAQQAQQQAAADSAGASGGGGGGATVSLLGGDDARRAVPGALGKKKMKPGEIRVQKDISELDAGKVGSVSWPVPSDLTSMLLAVTPDQGLWAGARFEFTIKVPDMYPHEPPKVHCKTPVYHPNVDTAGNVCLNILREEWKPVLDINAVIYGIIYLFYEPNPNDPLNHEAAALFRDNKAAFDRNVAASLRGGRVGAVTYPRLL